MKVSGSERVERIARSHEATILAECLAVSLGADQAAGVDAREIDIEGEKVMLAVTKA